MALPRTLLDYTHNALQFESNNLQEHADHVKKQHSSWAGPSRVAFRRSQHLR